jgi:hypothetical protein
VRRRGLAALDVNRGVFEEHIRRAGTDKIEHARLQRDRASAERIQPLAAFDQLKGTLEIEAARIDGAAVPALWQSRLPGR